MLARGQLQTLFTILLAWVTFATTSVAAPPLSTTPEEFLASQQTIRVCMGNGPNFGDQSTTMNIMNRMRQLGFQGTFEVIYEAKESLNKVITLFGLPQSIPEVYEDKAKKIIFIELNANQERIDNKTIGLIDLGFSAGKSDRICEADTTRSKIFVQFSPYFDSRGDWHAATSIEFLDKRDEISQTDSGKKYLIYPVATYQKAKDFLQNDPVGIALIQNKPALKTFLDGMENQKFNVQAVYGRTLRFVTNHDELMGSPSPSNILQTIAGARFAQLYGSSEWQKPLVIAVFDNYETYSAQLLQMIQSHHWGEYEKPGADLARTIIHQLKLEDAFFIGSTSSMETIAKLESLQPGQILLLSVGSLPKTVFDGIFTYSAANIFPPVLEGAGSFSHLVQLGIPFFECADTGYQFDDEPDEPTWTAGFEILHNEALKKELLAFYHPKQGYCGSLPNNQTSQYDFIEAWRQKIHEKIGRLIWSAHEKNSSYAQYFRDLKAETMKPENDRVRFALEEVARQVSVK